MNTRALTHYQRLAEEAETFQRELERSLQIHAALSVDELMSRFRPEPCNFCTPCDATPKPVLRWLFWTFAGGFSLVMTFAGYELARALLVLQGWLP